jgi:isoleucyl-tRNA synthetase
LEAEIEIFLNNSFKETLENVDLAELCIISKATVNFHEHESTIINAKKAYGVKCPVCWKINTSGCLRHS